jgi:hypothetical protein
MQKLNLKFPVLCILLLLAVASRLIPHPANFAPMGAMALFGSAYFNRKYLALLLPIVATWLSDLFINNVIYAQYYPNFTWFYEGFYWQYGTYVLIGLAGLIIFKKVSPKRILTGGLIYTLLFFIITNFGCWIGSTSYPQNFVGLMECYAMGMPFLKGTLLADLFYCGILFGSFEFIKVKVPALA